STHATITTVTFVGISTPSSPSSPFFFSYYRPHRVLHSFPTRRSSDLCLESLYMSCNPLGDKGVKLIADSLKGKIQLVRLGLGSRSEEHTSELQSLRHLVCRLLLEKKKNQNALQDSTAVMMAPPVTIAI